MVDGSPACGQFPDLPLIPGKHFLLKDFGVWAGKMFRALKGHSIAFYIQPALFFLLFPATGGNAAEKVIESVAQTIVQQFFTATFD